MATRTPLILNQITARIEELAAADSLSGSLIEAYSSRNLLINGNMDVYQRGSSGTRTNGEGYTVDRWSFAALGSGTSNWGVGTLALGDMPAVPSPPRYYLGANVVAGAAQAWMRQKIESVWTVSGGKVTLSFWMRAGVAGKKVGVRMIQDFGTASGASAAVSSEGPVFTLTTSFQKYTATFDLPSIAGKSVGNPSVNDCLHLVFDFAASSGYGNQLVNQTGLFEFTQVQLERGSIATDFDWRPLALELMLCQRYYQKSFPIIEQPSGNSTTSLHRTATAFTANACRTAIPFPVPMRKNPAITFYSAAETSSAPANLWGWYDPTGTWRVSNGTNLVSVFTSGMIVDVAAVGGQGMAAPNSYLVAGQYTADAEL